MDPLEHPPRRRLDDVARGASPVRWTPSPGLRPEAPRAGRPTAPRGTAAVVDRRTDLGGTALPVVRPPDLPGAPAVVDRRTDLGGMASPVVRPPDLPGTPPGLGRRTDPHGPARPAATDPDDVPPSGALDDALTHVRAGYTASYGAPLGRAAPGARTDRVRWRVSWRLAVTAGLVLLLVAGAVALHASGGGVGAPVAFPQPAGTATTGSAATGPEAVAGVTAGAGPTGAPTAGAGAASVGARVVVHVAGAVATPGVVHLDAGARVVDAIDAAGGAAADADLTVLNLARVLVDGEQVLVSRPGQAVPSSGRAGLDGATGGVTGGAGRGAAASGDTVDLNTADVTALDALPGIGPVLAQRIVEHRQERPFASVDELADVRGIGPTALERLRDLVRV